MQNALIVPNFLHRQKQMGNIKELEKIREKLFVFFLLDEIDKETLVD